MCKTICDFSISDESQMEKWISKLVGNTPHYNFSWEYSLLIQLLWLYDEGYKGQNLFKRDSNDHDLTLGSLGVIKTSVFKKRNGYLKHSESIKLSQYLHLYAMKKIKEASKLNTKLQAWSC